jgi:mannosyltransferase
LDCGCCSALALALRVWKLSDKNLGLDESISWNLTTRSVSRLIAWTAADVHPPLYYLLLKGWLWIFGDSLAALRSLSVISSLIALYLLSGWSRARCRARCVTR